MPAALETSQFATGQIARLLERLAHEVSRSVKSPSPEPVHDFRVSVRRFTQALVAFDEYLPGREVKKIRRSLKALMTLAGDVRNDDIAIKKLMRLQPGASPLKEKVRTRRKKAAATLVSSLQRWLARKSPQKWRKVLLPVQPPKSCSFPILDDHARQVVPKAAKVFWKAGERAADPKASAAELHHCRIEAKKLRYSLELFEGAFGPAAEAWLNRLREIQTLLGDINDIRTVRVLLSDLGATDDIDLRLKKGQKKKVRQFQDIWQEQFASGAVRQWTRDLRRPPRKPMARSVSIAARARAAGSA